MTRRPIIMGPYDPPKLIPKKEMNLTDTYSSNALSRWAQMNQIQTLNLESLYCDELACIRYKNGQWLYRDTNHFSVAGADLAIPLFEKILGRI